MGRAIALWTSVGPVRASLKFRSFVRPTGSTKLMKRKTRPLSRSKPHPLPPTSRFPSGNVDRRVRGRDVLRRCLSALLVPSIILRNRLGAQQTANTELPHPNALQEKFYWCTVTPIVFEKQGLWPASCRS